MKAILMSIKPQWVVKTLNGLKTIEVRKGTSLYKAINKLIAEQGVAPMLLYCTKAYFVHKTKGKMFPVKHISYSNEVGFLPKRFENTDHSLYYDLRGKVVARFNATADMINVVFEQYCAGDLSQQGLCESSCLSFDELHEYLNGYSGARGIGTAIHINDLEIFDKPKEISEFGRIVLEPRFFDGGEYYEEEKYFLTRAPQSFTYIEIE